MSLHSVSGQWHQGTYTWSPVRAALAGQPQWASDQLEAQAPSFCTRPLHVASLEVTGKGQVLFPRDAVNESQRCLRTSFMVPES